ncbi:hypothetical protein D3C78_1249720 [compost metagenome]
MAATETVGVAANRPQQAHAARIVASVEGDHRAGCRCSDLTGEHGVVVLAPFGGDLRGQQPFEQFLAACADERQRGVQIIEGIVAAGRRWGPAFGQRMPAVADIHPAQLQAPEQGAGVEEFHVQE